MRKTNHLLTIIALFVAMVALQAPVSAQTELPGRQVGSVTTSTGKTIYLAARQEKGVYTLAAYAKSNGKYVEEKAFRVGKGTQSSIKSVKFDDWKSTNPDKGYFAFNKNNSSVYLPLIVNNDGLLEGADRYIVYQFDGNLFVKKGTDGGFWLHPNLRKFNGLEKIFKTKDYLIRIDYMDDGTYRYAAWKNKKELKDMSAKPDLIISNGTYTEGPNGFGYYFDNKGYTYYVSYDKLTVFHGDKVILNQEGESLIY